MRKGTTPIPVPVWLAPKLAIHFALEKRITMRLDDAIRRNSDNPLIPRDHVKEGRGLDP